MVIKMAEAFLEEIYQDAKLCCEIRQVVQCAKVHDWQHETDLWNILMPKLSRICRKFEVQDREKALELTNYLQLVQEVSDKILMGDILEYRILPWMEEYMKQYGNIQTENEERDYLFESTVSGFLTIKALKVGEYLHSTVDPMWEAKQLAEYLYEPGKTQYVVRGCGLGYLIYQLYECSNGSAFIEIFEKDVRMVEYAGKYGVLDWVPKESLKIIVDEDPSSFLESALAENANMYIFKRELYNEKEDIAPILRELAVQQNTYYWQKKDTAINYWSNLRQNCKMISEFDSSHLDKDFIVVAGGPSLDDCMDFLRENQGKKTIIAVGTIFRKLLQAGIVPDMVTILDPDPIVYRQVKGLEEQKVPMLLSIEAPWKIAARYQGEKYLIPVGGTAKMLGLPEGLGEEVWEVGGTVTDLALAVAIRFGAEKIYLAGVDMAYPCGITHAKETSDRDRISLDKLMPVEGVDGGIVYTDSVMKLFLRQIEERIANTPQVKWYNLSRVGAKIAGTVLMEE